MAKGRPSTSDLPSCRSEPAWAESSPRTDKGNTPDDPLVTEAQKKNQHCPRQAFQTGSQHREIGLNPLFLISGF